MATLVLAIKQPAGKDAVKSKTSSDCWITLNVTLKGPSSDAQLFFPTQPKK